MTAKASLPSELLATSKLKLVHLEVTSKCNLRCTYCAVSQPEYKGYDLNVSNLPGIVADLKRLGAETISLNGHGETTFHNDWKDVFEAIVGNFPRTEITTNLARNYSDEEIELLSRVDVITVSLDTPDPVLLKDTRRHVDLGVVLTNIARIRGAARHRPAAKSETDHRPGYMKLLGVDPAVAPDVISATGTDPYWAHNAYRITPRFMFSCVVHDKNVLTLPALAHLAVAVNVSHVIFCNMTKYKDLPGVVNVQPVSSLSDTDALIAARESLKLAEGILLRNGLHPDVQDSLPASIDEAIANSWRKKAAPRPLTIATVKQPHAALLSAQRNFRMPEKGETRDCLDPWNFSIIYATGKVAPCCWHDSMYTLGKDGSLLDILSAEKTVKLRKQLLTGRLNKFCKTCPARGLTTTDDLREKVAARDD